MPSRTKKRKKTQKPKIRQTKNSVQPCTLMCRRYAVLFISEPMGSNRVGLCQTVGDVVLSVTSW